MDVSKHARRINGEEGYLVEGTEEEKDEVLNTLNKMTNFEHRFVDSDVVKGRGDLFITFSDPMEEQIGKITMETLRDDASDEVHLTSNTRERL